MQPPTPTRPLRADARRNRERVLAAARTVFARDGIEAQMDDLAAEAGVGVGTVYRHFPTKEAIVEALTADYFSRQVELAREAVGAADPWEAFAGYIRAGAELFAESRALGQLIADRPALMERAALAADAEHGLFGLIGAVMDRAKAAGTLRPDVEVEDFPTIMCALGSLHFGSKPYANWQRLLALVVDGLRADAPAASALPPLRERFPRT